jgi:enamine deaminase RidA (YjgF/YER057c/UK114 family)
MAHRRKANYPSKNKYSKEASMGRIETRLKELGIVLLGPQGSGELSSRREGGEILYVAGIDRDGRGPNDEDILPIKGKLGRELTVKQGYESARLTAINHLAMIKAVIGDLDKVVRIVKMIGYVNAAPGFQEAPWVLNGASDLLVQVFGPEKGKHARAALYQNELYEAPIEIEMTVQVEP